MDVFDGIKRQIEMASDKLLDPEGAPPPTRDEAIETAKRACVATKVSHGRTVHSMFNGVPSYEKIETLVKSYSIPPVAHIGEGLRTQFEASAKRELFMQLTWAAEEFRKQFPDPSLLLFGPITYSEISGGVMGVMSDFIEAKMDVYERVTAYVHQWA